MQIGGTSNTSPYLAAANATRSQGTASASNTASNVVLGGADGDVSGSGISTYDFSKISPAQMRTTVNGLIKSGKMSLDDSSSLVGMMGSPALRWAGSGTPSAEGLSQADNQPINVFATLKAGLTGAQSRGDTQNAQAISRALDVLQKLQGATATVDVRA